MPCLVSIYQDYLLILKISEKNQRERKIENKRKNEKDFDKIDVSFPSSVQEIVVVVLMYCLNNSCRRQGCGSGSGLLASGSGSDF